MPTVPTFQLCLDEDIDEAVHTIRSITGLSLDGARSLALALDGVAAAVFQTVGVNTGESRAILAAMWRQPLTAESRPVHRVRRAERDHEFLTSLGERIHVIRRARRITLVDLSRRTGMPVDMLKLVEAGTLAPSLLGLRMLAELFQVPLPMLVDAKATPLRVLRLLAERSA